LHKQGQIKRFNNKSINYAEKARFITAAMHVGETNGIAASGWWGPTGVESVKAALLI